MLGSTKQRSPIPHQATWQKQFNYPCCRPSILTYFAFFYAFILTFVLLTEEHPKSSNKSSLSQFARSLLIWRITSILCVLLGSRLLAAVSFTRRTFHAAAEFARQSRTGIFPSWNRRLGSPLGDMYNQELGEDIAIDSEPHILMTVRWWDQQCETFIHKSRQAGVNVIVVVPSADIAQQIQASNKVENMVDNFAGLYIVVDDNQNIRQEYDQDALLAAKRSPCRCLCISYLARGIFNEDFTGGDSGYGFGNGVYVLDRDGRICSIGHPGDVSDVLGCVREAKTKYGKVLTSCCCLSSPPSSSPSSSSSSSSFVTTSSRKNVPDEVIYVYYLRSSYMNDRRMQGISTIERTCGLFVVMMLFILFLLHAVTSFIAFYRFYIVPVMSLSSPLSTNITAVSDHGLWLSVIADTWFGMIFGGIPILLLLVAMLLALLFGVVLKFIKCVCSCILTYSSPCEELFTSHKSHKREFGEKIIEGKIEGIIGITAEDNSPMSISS